MVNDRRISGITIGLPRVLCYDFIDILLMERESSGKPLGSTS